MVISNLSSPLKPLAIANTRKGIMIIEIMENIDKIKIIIDIVLLAKSIACFLLCMLFLNIGMNAALRAPSAKNLLKIFGKEKAIMKASPIGPEPKKAANITSLKKPNIRLIKVHRPTVIKLFKNFDLEYMIYQS